MRRRRNHELKSTVVAVSVTIVVMTASFVLFLPLAIKQLSYQTGMERRNRRLPFIFQSFDAAAPWESEEEATCGDESQSIQSLNPIGTDGFLCGRRPELPFRNGLRYPAGKAVPTRRGGRLITQETLTEYIRRAMPDAVVTMVDKTGTMDHLKVTIVSDAFQGKNLLDRHRLIYQALDAPMKDGRIHALELTAKTKAEH
jgi:stress-induced morphogen